MGRYRDARRVGIVGKKESPHVRYNHEDGKHNLIVVDRNPRKLLDEILENVASPGGVHFMIDTELEQNGPVKGGRYRYLFVRFQSEASPATVRGAIERAGARYTIDRRLTDQGAFGGRLRIEDAVADYYAK